MSRKRKRDAQEYHICCPKCPSRFLSPRDVQNHIFGLHRTDLPKIRSMIVFCVKKCFLELTFILISVIIHVQLWCILTVTGVSALKKHLNSHRFVSPKMLSSFLWEDWPSSLRFPSNEGSPERCATSLLISCNRISLGYDSVTNRIPSNDGSSERCALPLLISCDRTSFEHLPSNVALQNLSHCRRQLHTKDLPWNLVREILKSRLFVGSRFRVSKGVTGSDKMVDDRVIRAVVNLIWINTDTQVIRIILWNWLLQTFKCLINNGRKLGKMKGIIGKRKMVRPNLSSETCWKIFECDCRIF